jgi:choline dehydrogenase/4-pyridoxate dehydrogenase
MNEKTSFDYVVIGAGSAGCALAHRLTEDSHSEVLLLEAGKWDRDPLIRIPIGWGRILQKGVHNWNYISDPVPGADNRQLECHRGKVVGGSSSINAMAYVRGHRLDYDRLADRGLAGWSYEEVLPYFRKQETWEGGESHYRGGTGPLATGESKYDDPLMEAYAEAARSLGHPWTQDYNGVEQEGFGKMQLTIRDGRRCSSSDAYLRPVLGRANLNVEVEAMVTRIVLQGSRATGVQFVQNGAKREVHARREVVLCAGTFNSPQILMLSGFGDPEHLRTLGIDVRMPLPGVGRNLHDHAGTSIVYDRRQPGPFHRSMRVDRAVIGLAQAYFRGTGFATKLPGGLTAFLRSSWDEPAPDLQLLFVGAPLDARPYLKPFSTPYVDRFFCRVVLIRPESRGAVFLRSASPLDAPRIFQNLLATGADIRKVRTGMRIFREIGRHKLLEDMVSREFAPGSDRIRDDDVDAYVRSAVTTSYHPAGTCRMGTADDPDAVVTADLKVIGTDNLRVVDASIFPDPIGGNINAPIIMATEKAADMIRGRSAATIVNAA